MRRFARPARRGSLAAATALALAVTVAGPAAADPGPGAPLLTGWLPYWTTSASLASYSANADLFANVSPFWHEARKGATAGAITVYNHPLGQSTDSAMAALRAAGKKVIPTITDGTGKGYMAGVLADPATRTAHVEQLLALAQSRGYDGIDLDYEGFAWTDGQATWASTKPNWAAFVTELAGRFHQQGLVVTAAVPISTYWVYDHATLGRVLDGVRVMSYDYAVNTPGAIAPLDRVVQETRAMLVMVPGPKLVMGVPEYGRDWVLRITDAQGQAVTSSSCPTGTNTLKRVVEAKDTFTLTTLPGATVRRDPVKDELQVLYSRTYTGEGKTCTVYREAWLADPQSVFNRVRAVVAEGAAGAALWTVGGEHQGQWDALRYFTYSRGPVYWSTLTSGAYPVYGAILMRYSALGRGASALGQPTSGEVNGAVPGSRLNTFQGGVILWSPATNANEVYGAILARYRALGSETGRLGLPTTGELAGSTAGSRWNGFAGGRIYWSQATGAHEVYGAILWRYAVLGAEASPLRLPTGGERAAAVPGARVSDFQAGRILWSPATGAQEVYGAIFFRHLQLGGEAGVMGLPTTGERPGAVPGSRWNGFQGGRIYWSPTTGVHEVRGAILLRYLAMGAEASPLGLPISGEEAAPSPGWRISNFEHGAIYWSPSIGTWVVYR